MGKNFYLKKKIINPTLNTLESLGCGNETPMIQELSNGYVYNNTYYRNLEEITEGTQIIHIGKSSYGWNFLLCVFPEYGINTYADWQQLFKDKNNVIEDEEGCIYSPEEMCICIADRQHGALEQCGNNIEEYEKQAVESFRRCFNDTAMSINTYDDLLRINNAVRGERGLLARAPNKFFAKGEKTFDYAICDADSDFS